MGNIEQPEQVVSVMDNGGEGIGLYRTEFQYLARASFPGMNELDGILLYFIVSLLIGTPYRRWALGRHEAARTPVKQA